MNSRIGKSNGAALLLVLMITAAMASMMIFMSEKGNNTANMANMIKQHNRAKIAVDNAQSEIIYELMTTPLGILGPNSRYPGIELIDPSLKNFKGEVTKRGDLHVRAQDLSGLVSLAPLNEGAFKRLLLHYGTDSSDINQIMDRFDDWQDIDNFRRLEGAEKGDYALPYLPNNTALQTVEELRYILQNDNLFEQIQPFLVLRVNPYIVRQFTPKSLYSAFGFEGQTPSQDEGEGGVDSIASGKLSIQITFEGPVNYSKRFNFERGPGLRPYFVSKEEVVN
ncbi:type II secretion system protein GspK [Pseudoalteromonas sp. OF7H-1]|uniref:general secretion pathway protein GspK n=1 Tax=Pseudoalteromonas sp. OF7H-1 TaxID=2917755 RepID=UPI001EF3E2B2|nr:general secretion pathway protein GspK [Pseudoalteromonas sp. OF7H-1]